VADFIGDTNLVPVTVADRGADAVTVSIAAEGGPIRARVRTPGPDARRGETARDAATWLSLRPESLTLVPAAERASSSGSDTRAGGGAPLNSLPGRVSDIVYAGAMVKVHAVVADGIAVVAHRAPSDPPIAPGAAVHILWPPDRGVLVGD
jgi:ABC-type Fe3+/spermidine/putrescine transport system ATPase subunit